MKTEDKKTRKPAHEKKNSAAHAEWLERKKESNKKRKLQRQGETNA